MFLRPLTEEESDKNLKCDMMNPNHLQCSRKVEWAQVDEDLIQYFCTKHKSLQIAAIPTIEVR